MSGAGPAAAEGEAGRVLITGGAGFIGANLADHLARAGHEVVVYDALLRPGVRRNLDWLLATHPRRITAVVADIRDEARLAAAVQRADVVFHLAAQVAVTTSLTDPREDFGTNLLGTVLLLDAVRRRPGGPVPLVFASTNKVYGDLGDVPLALAEHGYAPGDHGLRAHGVAEDRPLDFHTPYGCSKGAADQYVRDWARSYGVPTAVFRMSCIYGPRQMGTEDQGWLAHFLIRALRDEPVTVFGDGWQVRDVLHVQDAVAAYVAAWRRIATVAGQAFNLGGGPANAVSLRQVLDAIGGHIGRGVRTGFSSWRAGDQRWYVSDPRRAQAALGLAAPIPWQDGLADLADWLQRANAPAAPPRRDLPHAAEALR